VPIYGIYCGKYHIFQIGFTFFLIYISTLIRANNQFLEGSSPLLIICGGLYLFGILYIIDSLEKMQKKQIQLGVEIQKQADLLKQLNTDKDLFISILAHDLKNPFVTLVGLSELLAENINKFNSAEIETFVNNIYQVSQNTYNLLEDLIKWAQSQSGKLHYEPQILSFTTICVDILKVLNTTAQDKNITIKYFDEKNLSLFADNNMLKTVLRNLISNAIKFTNKGGEINIYASQTESNTIITVSDNGIGIAPERQGKLFDISQMKSTSGTAKESGTGLGLLLCKDFIEKHGGTIWVESEEGKGSNFKFSIPNKLG
jgi:signal transduction histidine kinase